MRGRGHVLSSRYKGKRDGWRYSLHSSYWTRLKGNRMVNVNILGRAADRDKTKHLNHDIQ